MLLKYGSKKLRDVLEPAISIATNGYPLVPNILNTINSVKELFLEDWKTSANIYLPNNQLPKSGSLFKNEIIAKTYQKILQDSESYSSNREHQIEHARKIWKTGFVATSIDKFCRENYFLDTTMKKHNGLLDADDLANWSATE